ncbi:tetratricopeptide repeat protein [Maridesulfovibrio bastinii]|uniref:tetratricopeptide repeat protein n=1 Tax=Maridesulfovibrio bastinii TaxID=47157 RepID=UPI000484C563|nr:tetratricopeptide repeat protein [Maridesulfovibrio bastinii]
MSQESTYFTYQPSTQKKADDKLLIKSVFSTEDSRGRKRYFLITELGSNRFEIQEINRKNLPAGQRQMIDRRSLTANYTLEMDFWEKKVRPAMKKLNSSLRRGEAHRSHGELYSAEMEYQDALKLDEENVRATFGLGQIYLDQNNSEKARDVFKKILNLDSAYSVEHKHMFNDFGIAMRKNGLYPEALEYYNRAVELDSEDENLYFNMARTYFESGDWENCIKYLTTCLKKNKGVEEAKKFCRFIMEKSETDEEMLEEFGSTELGAKLRSDILSLYRDMQLAAGMEIGEAIERTQKIRDRLMDIEERKRKEKQISENLYKLDSHK